MNALLRTLLLSAVMGLSFVALSPVKANADDYRDDYWSWYDGTYQPYYHRYYDRDRYRVPRYRYYDRYYDPYYGYYDPDYYYYPRYRDYGTPRFGYRDYGGGRGQVRVGPFRFGWR